MSKGRTSLSISRVYASGEANRWPWLVLRKKPPKANMWWILKLRKRVTCRLFIKGWRHIMSCRLFIKGWRHIMRCHLFVEGGRHIRSCLLFVEKKKLRTEFGIWKKPKFQSCRTENAERKEKTYPLNEQALQWMVSLVKRIPKEKTCRRGKRQLLILVLSEIRRVSFDQRVKETQ